ncbi:MAG: hypothetical protein WCJ07_05050, partial [Verrucomicrobiota bacterium]
MNRRHFLVTSLTAASAVTLGLRLDAAEAAAYQFDPTPDIIKAPKNPALWPEFRKQLAEWREKKRGELKYFDALYQRADFAWVPGSYVCYFLMLNDERFCDATSGRYLVKEWLAACQRDFGGVDSVVLW